MQDDLFEALCATLDQLTAGFVACRADGRILHANHAAQEMMEQGWPIQSQNGHVRAADRKRSDFLLECMQQAAEAATARGRCTICVHVSLATMQNDGGAAIATVKPLVVRKPPSAGESVLGLFVTRLGSGDSRALAGIAQCFALTPAEKRTLEQFVQGSSVAETASALALSQNTVKTHLQNIFAKTGSSRQPQLLRLVSELNPPIRLAPDEVESAGMLYQRCPCDKANGSTGPLQA
jgi:DNA-binding CsgD family transcriptional regulator